MLKSYQVPSASYSLSVLLYYNLLIFFEIILAWILYNYSSLLKLLQNNYDSHISTVQIQNATYLQYINIENHILKQATKIIFFTFSQKLSFNALTLLLIFVSQVTKLFLFFQASSLIRIFLNNTRILFQQSAFEILHSELV